MSQHADEELVVVRRRPAAERRKQLLTAIIAGVLLIIVAFTGYGVSRLHIELLQRKNSKLSIEFEETRENLMDVRRELAQIRVGADIDRRATEEAQHTIRSLEETLADQQEELAFYKGMMAPDEREKGINIRSWTVSPAAVENSFQFQLIVQQLAKVHRLLKGSVRVSVVGWREGQQKVYALSDLSQQLTDQKIKLRFKYFQVIEGELKLPPGFTPQRVDIIAESVGKNSMKLSRSYNWQ